MCAKQDGMKVIEEVMKIGQLSPKDSITADSIKFVEIIIALEEASGTEIELEQIYVNSYETYEDILKVFYGDAV